MVLKEAAGWLFYIIATSSRTAREAHSNDSTYPIRCDKDAGSGQSAGVFTLSLEQKSKVDCQMGSCRSLLAKHLFFRHILQGSGAACVTRTRDPIITNDVLYRLS